MSNVTRRGFMGSLAAIFGGLVALIFGKSDGALKDFLESDEMVGGSTIPGTNLRSYGYTAGSGFCYSGMFTNYHQNIQLPWRLRIEEERAAR